MIKEIGKYLARVTGNLLIYALSFILVLFFLNLSVDLTQESKEFLYLANIVDTVTEGKNSDIEKVKALTNWLSVNVKHAEGKYPFSQSTCTVAQVINSGVGNCGLQAENIIALSRYLGVKDDGMRKLHVSRKTGSSFFHTFAEITLEGKPRIFDPDLVGYVEDKNGAVLGLYEIIANPDLVENKTFKEIAIEARKRRTTVVPVPFERNFETPMPFGQKSFDFYKKNGAIITKLYLVIRGHLFKLIFSSFLVYLVILSVIVRKHTSLKRKLL